MKKKKIKLKQMNDWNGSVFKELLDQNRCQGQAIVVLRYKRFVYLFEMSFVFGYLAHIDNELPDT